jgi:hypothetical protein
VHTDDPEKAQRVADGQEAGMALIIQEPGSRIAVRRHHALRRQPRTGQVRHDEFVDKKVIRTAD